MRKSLECLKFEMALLTDTIDVALDSMNTKVISTVKDLTISEKVNLYSKISKDFFTTSMSLTSTVRNLKNRLEK